MDSECAPADCCLLTNTILLTLATNMYICVRSMSGYISRATSQYRKWAGRGPEIKWGGILDSAGGRDLCYLEFLTIGIDTASHLTQYLEKSPCSIISLLIVPLTNSLNKTHCLLKSDKLYTELSSKHRTGCTLLHTWCTDEYKDDIQVPSYAVLGCDWLSWLMCEEQICMKCAWARCNVRGC